MIGTAAPEHGGLGDSKKLAFRWIESPVLVAVLLFATRALLMVPALIGANLSSEMPEKLIFGLESRTLPGLWIRWDSGFYLTIATRGYSPAGEELAFFPGYPLLIRILSQGLPTVAAWSAFVISNLAFILAGVLLWLLVKREFGPRVALATIVTVSVFPTSFFFSAAYTESLFFLFSILVYWSAGRRRFILSAVFVSLASITRPSGFLLVVIPMLEQMRERSPRPAWPILSTGLVSTLGLAAYMGYLWFGQGSPFAFVAAVKRSNAWPWESVVDSIRVAATGYGGYEANWFMRVVSLEDLLATLLFATCAVATFAVMRTSLASYAVISLLFLLSSHGPYALGLYSMSRYVLGLFPCFIVLGVLLTKTGTTKWVVWSTSVLLLLFLTAWFAGGRWVA